MQSKGETKPTPVADLVSVPVEEHLQDLTEKHLKAQTLIGDMDRIVGQLRTEGASWAAIGRAVGITPQAAHQRWSSNGKEKHRLRQLGRSTSNQTGGSK
jgi:hypothetical protein